MDFRTGGIDLQGQIDGVPGFVEAISFLKYKGEHVVAVVTHPVRARLLAAPRVLLRARIFVLRKHSAKRLCASANDPDLD